ncbi:MAG: hypothetical protein WBG16_04995 [Bradyrhizobium sp.]|jgi:hypothetical protein|uniref:hypothetical protein n=1 Tax=Bradyrhizobium sp. TaxID=376 RepID=UPI003C73B83E
MTARTTYTGAVQTAATAQLVTVNAAETTRQETINQSGCNVGYNLQTGNYGAFSAAVKAANLAKLAALNAAEVAKQAAVMVARDTLKSTGDVGAV